MIRWCTPLWWRLPECGLRESPHFDYPDTHETRNVARAVTSHSQVLTNGLKTTEKTRLYCSALLARRAELPPRQMAKQMKAWVEAARLLVSHA